MYSAQRDPRRCSAGHRGPARARSWPAATRPQQRACIPLPALCCRDGGPGRVGLRRLIALVNACDHRGGLFMADPGRIGAGQHVSARTTSALSEMLKIRPCTERHGTTIRRRRRVVPSPPGALAVQRDRRRDAGGSDDARNKAACAEPRADRGAHARDRWAGASTALLSPAALTPPVLSATGAPPRSHG